MVLVPVQLKTMYVSKKKRIPPFLSYSPKAGIFPFVSIWVEFVIVERAMGVVPLDVS